MKAYLNLFVRKVDTELFNRIRHKVLETKNIQNSDEHNLLNISISNVEEFVVNAFHHKQKGVLEQGFGDSIAVVVVWRFFNKDYIRQGRNIAQISKSVSCKNRTKA